MPRAVYKHYCIKISFCQGQTLPLERIQREAEFQELSAEFPLSRGTSHGSPRLPALQGTLLNMCKVSIFLTGTITNAMQE